MNFYQRVNAFWEWFGQNDAELSRYFTETEKPSLDKWVDLVDDGLQLLSDNAVFNMGGDYDFTFTVAGGMYRFYLNPFIVACAPQKLREKWHFFPFSQPEQNKDFHFRMNGTDISEQSVQIKMEQNPDTGNFRLQFYQPELAALEDRDEAYSVFFNMMGLCIGDALDLLYVENVEMLDAPDTEMFALTELAQKISEQVLASGKALCTRPDERYMAYQRQPEPSGGLRQDVMSGNTSYAGLINEFYNGQTTSVEQLESYGAAPVFLVFGYSEQADRGELLSTRYEIEEELETRVLGKRGTGQELGLALGGAMGTGFVYIDLLLYDKEAFLEQAKQVLKKYPYKFYLSAFRPGSPLLPMFEK